MQFDLESQTEFRTEALIPAYQGQQSTRHFEISSRVIGKRLEVARYMTFFASKEVQSKVLHREQGPFRNSKLEDVGNERFQDGSQ